MTERSVTERSVTERSVTERSTTEQGVTEQGVTGLLDDTAIADALTRLTEWRHDGDSVVRTVTSATFPAAVSLVARVAEAAEAADHHPDIDIRYTAVTYRLSTHSAGGITTKDLELAEAIDRLAAGTTAGSE